MLRERRKYVERIEVGNIIESENNFYISDVIENYLNIFYIYIIQPKNLLEYFIFIFLSYLE